MPLASAASRVRHRSSVICSISISKIRQVSLTRNSKKSPRAREHDRPEGVRDRQHRHAGAPPEAAASALINDYGHPTAFHGTHKGRKQNPQARRTCWTLIQNYLCDPVAT
jgi:hypothetical protein